MRYISLPIAAIALLAAFAVGRMTAPASPALAMQPAVTFSHFECYQAKFGGQFGATVELTDQFQQYNSGVGAPQLFCTPVMKKVISGHNLRVPSPADHLTCYSIQGPSIDQTRKMQNQFIRNTVTVGTPTLLCVPTHKTG
jgi:hypothetical protein